VALAGRGIHHKRTRPYRPRNNCKAERFIQTSLREWIYAAPFESCVSRTAAMAARPAREAGGLAWQNEGATGKFGRIPVACRAWDGVGVTRGSPT